MTAVVIVAAGQGTRAETEVPKQYVELDRKTVLQRTIECFLALEEISRVTVVISESDRHHYQTAVTKLMDPRLTEPVVGGNTRTQSVRAGLASLASDPPQHVLIHDAARPFVSASAIKGVLDVLKIHDGAFVALPIVDAIWRTDGGFAISPMDRKVLWRAQTPQGFQFNKIFEAHRNFSGDAADDVEVARAAGLLVKIVEGSEANFKITTPADFSRAEVYLKHQGTAPNS